LAFVHSWPLARLPSTLGSAAPVNGLTCAASMSNAHPKDYTTTVVDVTTAGRARVTTVAHYKTTSTTHQAIATGSGRATIPYRISSATPGRPVPVNVTVALGARTGGCSTGFTPQR
jgi:hypothetical protein